MNITYSECASVTLVIYHSMRMRHFVVCDSKMGDKMNSLN